MKKGRLIPALFLTIFLARGFTAGDALAATQWLDIRQWSAPDHTRVVIDLDGPPIYEVPPPLNPLILRMNLQKVSLPKGKQEIFVNDKVIRKIRVKPVEKGGVEVTLLLIKPARWDVFVLKPFEDKPNRLVIDVSRPDLEEKEKAERQVSQKLKTKKTRIVVIDPGHGGEDPGAIGPARTREKDVVLALAKKLQKALDGTGEVRAFLTRRHDYYVSLNDRIKIAQEYGADLFISLHANGNPKRSVRGTSIYCLSLKGASDKAAELLARKENASDMMGGISLASTQRDLDSILLDLEQTHTINESLQLGGMALSELGRINHIQFTQPRQAGFAVLKAPSIPSMLVEAAHITNPVEERILRQERFQLELTRAIVAAVKKFMPQLAVKEEGAAVESPQSKGQGTKG
jgi:N-acetylmuramoyl-L-alanine amidase